MTVHYAGENPLRDDRRVSAQALLATIKHLNTDLRHPRQRGAIAQEQTPDQVLQQVSGKLDVGSDGILEEGLLFRDHRQISVPLVST